MTYQALYRQLRPQQFSDVVGQEHITRTLSNAVMHNFIAHAYLFAGPRGVGKTSTARILARAVNCVKSPVKDPCNDCALCQSILEGRALDVIEIDAASNNGVDEIRELREKVKYSPIACRYKVYIIDEVHMLSTAAFNALLKTLEEPPSHVIFILATTEAHKIPATIKSRCQRFDFHRIKMNEIFDHLADIAQQLQVVIEPEAAHMIARAADGSLRDAISILDQCLAYSENKITLSNVMELLGTVDDEVFYQITSSIVTGKITVALKAVGEIYQQGRSLEQFLIDYLHYLRGLLQLQAGINNDHGIIMSNIALAATQAQELGSERLYTLIHSIVKASNEIKYAQNQRLVVELAILESQFLLDTEVTQLAARISFLEQQLRGKSVEVIDNAQQIVAKKSEDTDEADDYDDIDYSSTNSEEFGEYEEDDDDDFDFASLPPQQANQSLANGEVSLALIERKWGTVLQKVKEADIITHALLKDALPVAYNNQRLVLQFDSSFHCEQVTNAPKKKVVTGVLESVLGVKIDINGEVANHTAKKKATEKVIEEKVDIVQTVLDLFDGKIVTDTRKEGN